MFFVSFISGYYNIVIVKHACWFMQYNSYTNISYESDTASGKLWYYRNLSLLQIPYFNILHIGASFQLLPLYMVLVYTTEDDSLDTICFIR